MILRGFFPVFAVMLLSGCVGDPQTPVAQTVDAQPQTSARTYSQWHASAAHTSATPSLPAMRAPVEDVVHGSVS